MFLFVDSRFEAGRSPGSLRSTVTWARAVTIEYTECARYRQLSLSWICTETPRPGIRIPTIWTCLPTRLTRCSQEARDFESRCPSRCEMRCTIVGSAPCGHRSDQPGLSNRRQWKSPVLGTGCPPAAHSVLRP